MNFLDRHTKEMTVRCRHSYIITQTYVLPRSPVVSCYTGFYQIRLKWHWFYPWLCYYSWVLGICFNNVRLRARLKSKISHHSAEKYGDVCKMTTFLQTCLPAKLVEKFFKFNRRTILEFLHVLLGGIWPTNCNLFNCEVKINKFLK